MALKIPIQFRCVKHLKKLISKLIIYGNKYYLLSCKPPIYPSLWSE